MGDEEDQKKYISMKKAMDGIRTPEQFMEIYNKDEFGQTGKLKPYKCQFQCGFSGGFFDVAKHERYCTYKKQSTVMPVQTRGPMVVSRSAPTFIPAGNTVPSNVIRTSGVLSSGAFPATIQAGQTLPISIAPGTITSAGYPTTLSSSNIPVVNGSPPSDIPKP